MKRKPRFLTPKERADYVSGRLTKEQEAGILRRVAKLPPGLEARAWFAVLDGVSDVAARIAEIRAHPVYLSTIQPGRHSPEQATLDNAEEWSKRPLRGGCWRDWEMALQQLQKAQTLVDAVYVRIIGPQAETGRKIREASKLGGRRKNKALPFRDVQLAKIYQARRPHSRMTPTALKRKIGEEQKRPLKRSAAVDAINRGLKILSGERGKPDA